eukprot:CAMPEP_0171119306 /NCGR_PEP_ID=MMETSP0766_2-20121228/96971_1 /TAXON_ID=439317 /ORGANISM="Gambierdiscus australes, Strain CAWD 149" /LENGTH=291 /DNA_ID=CAMNT_0011581969 /DNA_START=14 /DNA_END=886 /DNA_ORIENTATION=-
MDLAQVPHKITCIFLVLTISQGSFELVQSAYARIVDQSASKLAQFDIEGGRPESGLIIAQLVRTYSKRWAFQAVGDFIDGPCNTWKAAKAQLTQLFWESKDQTADGPAPLLESEDEEEVAGVPSATWVAAGRYSRTGSLDLPPIHRRNSSCVCQTVVEDPTDTVRISAFMAGSPRLSDEDKEETVQVNSGGKIHLSTRSAESCESRRSLATPLGIAQWKKPLLTEEDEVPVHEEEERDTAFTRTKLAASALSSANASWGSAAREMLAAPRGLQLMPRPVSMLLGTQRRVVG